jgi:hypothetical protein
MYFRTIDITTVNAIVHISTIQYFEFYRTLGGAVYARHKLYICGDTSKYDQRKLTVDDFDRLCGYIDMHNQVVNNLLGEFDEQFLALRQSFDLSDVNLVDGVSRFLYDAVWVRLEYLLAIQRLQLERQLEGVLYQQKLGNAPCKIATMQHQLWLHNRVADIADRARIMQLPVHH